MAAYAENPQLTLASEEELATIAEVRKTLEPELSDLKAKGKDFLHTTGDIFFTRCLRGNNGDTDETAKWYRNFIALREKHGLDTIHADMEASKTPWINTAMPHYADVSKYYNTIFSEENLWTLKGNVVWYDALGDTRPKNLLDEVGVDKYVKFQLYAFEMRTSTLDRLSRKHGRMVKIVRIMDFEDAALWKVRNKELSTLDQTQLFPVLMGTSCETIHSLYFINFPRFAAQLWSMLKSLLPPRLQKRVVILDNDYMQDKEFMAEVGPKLMEELLSRNRSHNEKEDADSARALEGDSQLIGAGRVMERVVAVEPGQKVSWTYHVASPQELKSHRGFLGRIASTATSLVSGTEIVFSVNAIWTDKQYADVAKIPAKVRSAGLEHGDAAEFWVDGASVDFAAGAGLNVVAIDPSSKERVLSKSYDTVGDADAASGQLVEDMAALPRHTMVLVAVKGTGAEKLTEQALEALKWVGSTMKAGHWHEGYALIGCKGGTKGGLTVAEARGNDVVAHGDVPAEELEAELVAPQEVSAESSEVTGSTPAFERPALVAVRWSNYHSFVTRKMVAAYKVTVD